MNNRATGIYYAAAIFQRDIVSLIKKAKEEKIPYCVSQNGCPLGMQGVYFEFLTIEDKIRFLTEINGKIQPAVVWAS